MNLFQQARAAFAAAVNVAAGGVGRTVKTWAPYNAQAAGYQHSRHTVAQDKRDALRARNRRKNK